MTINHQYHSSLRNSLLEVSSVEKANSMRRYFPNGLHCIGAVSADINAISKDFIHNHSQLTPDEFMELSEYILENSEYHEEILVAYRLIENLVKKNYDDNLLDRFKFWLENYANNWALVDDLCIKAIYNYLLDRPNLIEETRSWVDSDNPWCRRASNVVWVKFINRKIGKSVYRLNTDLVFSNCDKLISDPDEFVQKSVGWLLKATSIYHREAVIDYIRTHQNEMKKSTITYALEKVPKEIKSELRNEVLL